MRIIKKSLWVIILIIISTLAMLSANPKLHRRIDKMWENTFKEKELEQ